MQVLRGISPACWTNVKQLVVEVHSTELLEEVRALVVPHFDRVVVEKDSSLAASELYLLYATPAL